MKRVGERNASLQDTTASKTPPDDSPERLEELLREEARHAREAVQRHVHDLQADLQAAARPQVVTRSHPWMSTGAAAATGFAVGSALASRFRHSSHVEAAPAPAAFTPSRGLAAIGLAGLVKFMQSPAASAVPAAAKVLFDLWRRNQASQSLRKRAHELNDGS